MNEQLDDEQKTEILAALNKAIEDGPWDKSNFLHAIGKNIVSIRDDFLTHLGASPEEQVKVESLIASKLALRSRQQEIFVSLYCSDGNTLSSWERIVTNLPSQTISRPIYEREEHLKELLKVKEHKQNEAYVAVFIEKSDILSFASDKILKDKLGIPLLNLKDKTLKLENITRFEHSTGTYNLVKGHLIKV